MYEWHGKKYWGAAHGLAGINHVLMDMEWEPVEVENVKGTLCHMIKNRFPGGNYPQVKEVNQTGLCIGATVLLGSLLPLLKQLRFLVRPMRRNFCNSCGCRGGGMENGSP